MCSFPILSGGNEVLPVGNIQVRVFRCLLWPISAGADAPQRMAPSRSWALSVLVKSNADGSSEQMKTGGQVQCNLATLM